MKKLRKISKLYYLRQIVACWLVSCMLFVLPAQVAMATVSGGVFKVGTGTINDGIGIDDSTVLVNQLESVIEWGGIDTTSSQSLSFSQLGGLSNSAVLNRIMSGNQTQFDGALNGADMRIFIVNPAGIVFGSTATINVTQLVASSLDIDNTDFLNGLPYDFSGGATAGDITNEGTINAEIIALIGKNVLNKGALVADQLVIMAAGDTVTISESGSSVAVDVSMGTSDFKVQNLDGSINVDGDTAHVILAAGDIWSAALIKASSDGDSDAVATVVIDAEGDVDIDDDIEAVATGDGVGGFDAIATITIDAGGDVEIEGTGNGDAGVEALAHNDIEVDIDNYDNEVTVNLTVENLENKAGVTITSNGDEGGVFVKADGTSSKVGISAKAYNELELDQHTGGKEWIPDPDAQWWEFWKGEWVDLEAYAAVLNLDVTGLVNRSDIGIKATNGNVEVGSYDDWSGTEAKIGAKAYNEFEMDFDETTTVSLELDGLTNDAGIGITAGYDVLVVAEDGGESGIFTEAFNVLEPDTDAEGTITVDNITNNAAVVINAEGNVEVIAECMGETSDAYIYADAWNEVPEPENEPANVKNNASVGITAGEDVKVMAFDGGDARIEALTEQGTDNTASVKIATKDGDVLVHGVYGDAAILAEAREGDDNIATIDIDAVGGDVKVIDIGEIGDTAKIKAVAEDALNSNTADIQITATATTSEEEEGEGETYLKVDCGDVKVIAKDGGHADIKAFAGAAGEEEDEGTSNTANVTIHTNAAEGTRRGELLKEAVYMLEPAVYEEIAYTEGGDVKVIAKGGEASIGTKAKDGDTNTASTIICTEGDVQVIAERDGDAGILAQAKYGLNNDAYVGIGAWGDVVVQAGQLDMVGCDALIRAEAEMGDIQIRQLPVPGEEPLITTADAEVVVFSHEGSVDVLAYNRGHSGIEAEAQGAHENTAKVGVAAAADLSLADVAIPDDELLLDELLLIDDYMPLYYTGNVLVQAFGRGSRAGIVANAHDATSILEYPVIPIGQEVSEPTIILPGENTADVVVCAPGEIAVINIDSRENPPAARIRAVAGDGDNDELNINTASTQVYASDVEVSKGARIAAVADGDQKFVGVDEAWSLGDSMPDWTGFGDGATLIIDDYSKRKDCPTCPPCPICDLEDLFLGPAAPLPQVQLEIPTIQGCPKLIQAASMELGVAPESIQISIGNALALNPTIQACDACATLIDAAAILRDEDGSRMAAMVQVFNELAPGDAPFTPEMSALIATAFAGTAGGAQYASVTNYIDAFVQYYAVLDTGLGSPVGDSLAYVMNKYGAGVTGSDNANIAAFVASRLETGETFGN